MLFKRLLIGVGVVSICTGCSCMDHLNPAPFRKKLDDEHTASMAEIRKLNEDGSLPTVAAASSGESSSGAGAAAESATADIGNKYATLCVACHGESGKGDGAAAAGLNPKPRNFTDKAWQASVDDARIAKVIKEGGASVGLSPTMAPWGAMLTTDAEIAAMVAKVREFGK